MEKSECSGQSNPQTPCQAETRGLTTYSVSFNPCFGQKPHNSRLKIIPNKTWPAGTLLFLTHDAQTGIQLILKSRETHGCDFVSKLYHFFQLSKTVIVI